MLLRAKVSCHMCARIAQTMPKYVAFAWCTPREANGKKILHTHRIRQIATFTIRHFFRDTHIAHRTLHIHEIYIRGIDRYYK